MKFISQASCAAFAIAVGTSAMAAPQVDQSQTSADIGYAFNNNSLLGQSFTAGLTGELTDITVASNGQENSSGTLTLEILSGDGTGGTVLGSSTQNYVPNSFNFSTDIYAENFDVSSLDISVAAGSQYTFLFSNVTGPDFPGRGIDADDNNPYAGGREYASGFGNFTSNTDLQFSTEVDTSPTTTPVPDSGATAALVGCAVLGLAVFRRRLARQ